MKRKWILGLSAVSVLIFFLAYRITKNEVYEQAVTGNSIEVKPRLADRFLLESILLEIFGPAAKPVVIKNIFMPASSFGGPCDFNAQVRIKNHPEGFADPDTLCPGGKVAANLSMIGVSSVIRSSYMAKACEELSKNTQTLEYALAKVVQGAAKPLSLENLKKAFELFHPTEEPPEELLRKIESIAAKAASPHEQWSLVMMALCVDPSWQLI